MHTCKMHLHTRNITTVYIQSCNIYTVEDLTTDRFYQLIVAANTVNGTVLMSK